MINFKIKVANTILKKNKWKTQQLTMILLETTYQQ